MNPKLFIVWAAGIVAVLLVLVIGGIIRDVYKKWGPKWAGVFFCEMLAIFLLVLSPAFADAMYKVNKALSEWLSN